MKKRQVLKIRRRKKKSDKTFPVPNSIRHLKFQRKGQNRPSESECESEKYQRTSGKTSMKIFTFAQSVLTLRVISSNWLGNILHVYVAFAKGDAQKDFCSKCSQICL